MQPSHLLSHEIEQHHAALLQEAEHARLARLARPETAPPWQRWFALLRQMSTRLFWRKAAPHRRSETPAIQSVLDPALPAACCCACSL